MAGYNRIAAGERIRNRRMIMGLTQEELAEKSVVLINTARILNAGPAVCPLTQCLALHPVSIFRWIT